jgi:hypothetical protein
MTCKRQLLKTLLMSDNLTFQVDGTLIKAFASTQRRDISLCLYECWHHASRITHSKEGLQVFWSANGSSKEHEHGAVSPTVLLEGHHMVYAPGTSQHVLIDFTFSDRNDRLWNRSTLKGLQISAASLSMSLGCIEWTRCSFAETLFNNGK